MISTSGIVASITNGDAFIIIESNSGCSSCSGKNSCSQPLLSSLFSHDKKPLRLKNDIDAKVGDVVKVSFNESSLQQLSFLIYLAPLIFLFIGGLSGTSDNQSILFGMLGLLIGFVFVRFTSQFLQFKQAYQATISYL